MDSFDLKIAFFWCALPPQNYYILAPKAPFERFEVLSAENGYLKRDTTKEGPFGSAGGLNPYP